MTRGFSASGVVGGKIALLPALRFVAFFAFIAFVACDIACNKCNIACNIAFVACNIAFVTNLERYGLNV